VDHAKVSYQSFVNDGSDRCPWSNLKRANLLGQRCFYPVATQVSICFKIGARKNSDLSCETPLNALLVLPDGYRQAQKQYGYRIQEIAGFVGVHRNTVSRWIKGTAGVRSQNAPIVQKKDLTPADALCSLGKFVIE